MSFDSKRALSSHKHWTLDWWHLWPLVDGERRPIQWLDSSIITSHPLSPVVVGRSFPSGSSFILPSPPPVLSNPSAYDPPSIIEVSSDGEFIFAFFGGRGCEHFACIWNREVALGMWRVSIYWQMRPGQGIVLAKWLGNERTWIHSSPRRVPPLGPTNPFAYPALLLITRGHIVQIVHRVSQAHFQLVSASLRYPSQATLADRPAIGEITNGPGGLTLCDKAAVGLGYNDSTIIIATHSKLIPPTSASNPEFPEQFGAPPPPPSPSISSLENFGPEQAIHLCEVKITAYNFTMGVTTKPLPPIFPQITSSSHLNGILIVPHLTVEEPSSPDGSTVDNSSPKGKVGFKSGMHVVLSYLDLGDYASPKSDLMCFELKRASSSLTESSKAVTWLHRHLHTRTITNAAVCFLLPSCVPTSNAVVAGFLDIEGSIPRSYVAESKEASIGKIVRMRLPQMIDDEDWEPSRLMAKANDIGADPPVSAAISPSELFVCTSNSAWSSDLKLSVHAHPTPKILSGALSLTTLSERLLSLILFDRPSTDIVHFMANPSFELSSVYAVVQNTFSALESSHFPAQDWHARIAGILLEIYRTRSRRLPVENPAEVKEQMSMDERWHVALDICSVKALNCAFDACKEDDGYDMGPVWHLIGLLTWLVDFLERLVRACVLWEGSLVVHAAYNSKEMPEIKEKTVNVKKEAMEIDNSLFDAPAPEAPVCAPPPLIHLVHPYPLDNLISAISHLNTFRTFLDTLTPSQLKTSIAKEVVVDVIDCSAIDFKELESALRKIDQLDEFAALDADTVLRCFCFLSPPSSTQGLLVKACSLVTSPTAVSKPRLFIKPSEFVDGISRLNLETAKMNKERDIVSKGILGRPGTARTCARCNGKTETGRASFPRSKTIDEFARWTVWEYEWRRCICGGVWEAGAAP